MKLVPFQIHLVYFLIRDLPTGRVFPTIQSACHLEPFDGRRARDQVYNCLIIPKRLPAPIRGYERKQPVFYLVPFAGARRKVTTEIKRPVSFANFCNSNFQSLKRTPLLPPPSAVMSNPRVCEYNDLPSLRHHPRMDATANAPVS